MLYSLTMCPSKKLPKILNPSLHFVALSIARIRARLSARALRVRAAHSRRYSILVFRGVLTEYLRYYGVYVTGMSANIVRGCSLSLSRKKRLLPIHEMTKYFAITYTRYTWRRYIIQEKELEPCA